MAMRQNCKHFASRTYPSGDTVRKCDLNLAPEAPWRCPADCPKYEARLADVNWNHGSLIVAAAPPEPESLGNDDSIAELLKSAEEIVRDAGPAIIEQHEREQAEKARLEAQQRSNTLRNRLKRFTRWFRKPNDKDENK